MSRGNLLNGDVTSPNQLYPHKNKWAYDLYCAAQNNNWVPTKTNMQTDISQWKSRHILSDDERLMIKRCLGFFAGTESLVSNNLLLNIARYITDGECRNYINRQGYEESLHNQTIIFICQSLDLNPDELYLAYSNIPSVKAKDDFLMQVTTDLVRPDFDTNTIAGQKELLQNIFAYYILCEGLLFYSGFAMLLSLRRQNPMKMPGIGEQIQYTLRDEQGHLEFGTNLIKLLLIQYPDLNEYTTISYLRDLMKTAIDLETQFARDTLPNGLLGINHEMITQYVHYLADRRLKDLGFPLLFNGSVKNPFTWLSEVIDIRSCTNFFEGTVTEYKIGGLQDDL